MVCEPVGCTDDLVGTLSIAGLLKGLTNPDCDGLFVPASPASTIDVLILRFAGSWSEISEGLGRNHFDTVMEGLGRATSLATEPFSAILDRAFRQSERGRSFIVITPQIDDSWQPELRHLEELSSTPVCVLTPDILAEEKEADIA